MPDARPALMTIFEQALERADPAERAAYLEQACGEDAGLRRRVEGLLVADEKAGRFLEPGPEAFSPMATARPGDVIAGRYKLRQKLGEGGMGEVWVAEQAGPIRREVAMKLIKPGMDSLAVVRRFEQERQALALMDHPNIAKVFDGGLTAAGRPFFAMELVDGLPLTRFCDEARLPLRDRLDLFATVCRAVQHAHQKGIIHRDLKPANILVTRIDGRAVPRVIDFGVAKATAGKLGDGSIATQPGVIVGTLEYMAPEQAGLTGEGVDTRADIYSLGVILYELLTGLRPIDAGRLEDAAAIEMIRRIREDEPARPSTRLSVVGTLPSAAALRRIDPPRLLAMLRGELDWVAMKCLEKGPDRRYESADGLARDVQRYLDDEPVEARPPSARYRLAKFVRRHRGPVIAAVLVILALKLGLLSTAWGLIRVRQEQRRAEEAYRIARMQEAEVQLQRARAEEREAMAIDAVKRFRDAVAEDPELKNNPDLAPLRKKLLRSPLESSGGLREGIEPD